MAFVASLTHSLAWPAGAVVVVIVLRRPIGRALNRGVRRLKAGPVEVEFDQELAEVREELRKSPELAAVEVPALAGRLSDDLARLAEISPRSAVMEAFIRVEARLSELVEGSNEPTRYRSARQMARLARDRGLISDETLTAVDGLAILRNLVAHSPSEEIDAERARNYLALADAVLFALRPKPAG